MTRNLFVLVGIFSVAMTCIIGAGFILFAMIGEINRKLPDNEQISYLWGHPAAYSRIYAEYKRFYPEGRLLLLYKIVLYSGFAFLVVCAWLSGMFK